MEGPPSSTIVAAALIMQIALLAILSVGLALYGAPLTQVDRKPWNTKPWGLLVAASLLGLGPLVLSEDVTSLGRAMFGDRHFAVFSLDSAIKAMTFVDILVIGRLIRHSGGTQTSPFTSALFTIPAFSIFLWQSYSSVSWQVALVCLQGWIYDSSTPYGMGNSDTDNSASYHFVACAMLVLTAYVSYITRR